MTLNNSFEFSFLQSALTSGTTKNHYWLGAYYSSGEWKWVDTAQRADFLYSLSKTISGYKATIKDYYKYVGSQFYYADGMSYSRNSSLEAGAFICEWDSNSAYNRGRANFSGGVLVSAGMNRYVLKAALTKGSKTDTDNDGIPDYDELDLKSIEKIGGKGATQVSWQQEYDYIYDRYSTKATTIIPKWTSNNKITNALEKNGGTTVSGTESSAITRTYPKMESDPTTEDTDGDYYFDKEDKNCKKHNATIIEASLLDDSKMFDYSIMINPYNNGTYPTVPSGNILIPNSVEGLGKTFIKDMPDGLTKAGISYERRCEQKIKFNLITVLSNDFEFEISFDDETNSKTAVEDDDFITIISDKKEKYVEKYLTSDNKLICHFNVVKGQECQIEFDCKNINGNLNIVIYQDNWVYAPKGGVRFGGDPYLDELFLRQDSMIELCEDILKSHNQAEWKSVREQVEKNDKDALEYWLENHKVLMKELNGALKMQIIDAESAIKKYVDISTSAQWILEYTKSGNAGTILGEISKYGNYIGNVLPITDKIFFVGDKLYEAKCNQLPNAMIAGNFNVCVYNNSMTLSSPGYSKVESLLVPFFVPYSCCSLENREGINDNYISRYMTNDRGIRERYNINIFF